MPKIRLDKELTKRKLVVSRSQAESWIKLGKVSVDGRIVNKSGFMVDENSTIKLDAPSQYVSRAGLKLASVARDLAIDFEDRVVLDVGSSTGGFTDYSLQNGAKKVFAVDVGTDQLHQSLRDDKRIELHEKTDIRDFVPSQAIDIVVIDVSFISLREILPYIASITSSGAQIVAMVKPQFEASPKQVSKGVIKNDKVRREILMNFENWTKKLFVIVDKKDSEVPGAKGNRERFYLLKPVKR